MTNPTIIPPESRLRHKTAGYTFLYYNLLFLFLSLLGWLWEVCLYFVTEHRFVNRGVLLGPWLPIYGAGGLILFFLLYRLKKHPILVFFAAATGCSALEYFASWFLEKQWGIRWWDYSSYFMNLNGRICLIAGILFGVAALLLLYFLIPVWEKQYERIPVRLRKSLSLCLLVLFLLDASYAAARPNTGNGVTYSHADYSFRYCMIPMYTANATFF